MHTYSAVKYIHHIILYIYMYTHKSKKRLQSEQKVGMMLQKGADTGGVGTSNMKKSIYLLTTISTSHTHRFRPLSTIFIHTWNVTLAESGWNIWVWLVGVVIRRQVWAVGVGGIYGCG